MNIVPAADLCDQHLKQDFKRIESLVKQLIFGTLKISTHKQSEYSYNPAKHNKKFFLDKLPYLKARYEDLRKEHVRRALPIPLHSPTVLLLNDLIKHTPIEQTAWSPTEADIEANYDWLAKNFPKNGSYANQPCYMIKQEFLREGKYIVLHKGVTYRESVIRDVLTATQIQAHCLKGRN